jgi:cell fate regulator YaaT (PSP1 superfamily)
VAEHRKLDVIAQGTPPDAGGTPGKPSSGAPVPPWLAFEMDLADDAVLDAGALLHNAAGVRIETARVVDHDAGDVVYRRGTKVVCETPSGVAWGVVAVASRRVLVKGGLPRILRLASYGDLAAEAQLRAREQAVYAAARKAVRELGLGVKVVRAESLSSGQRFAVYFASEDKFPFQDLLVALSQATRERIELRQVGLRDAAKVIGGVGPCGLQLCCNTFLADFAPVTVKMAKDQGLGVNPQKLSGVCGRLLCCLVYEEAFYRAQRKLVPRVGDRVVTDEGEGRVRDVDVLEMQVKVVLDSGRTVTRPVAELSRTPHPS